MNLKTYALLADRYEEALRYFYHGLREIEVEQVQEQGKKTSFVDLLLLLFPELTYVLVDLSQKLLANRAGSKKYHGR